jgi:hypothetical protein
MAHRYRPPEHVSEVFLSTGPRRANSAGEIVLATNAPSSDHDQLKAAGCRLVGEEKAKVATARSHAKGGKKSSGKSKAVPAAKPASEQPASED